MHTNNNPFDDSKYSEAEKKAATEYAQKMDILFLKKTTVGKKRKDVAPADNPYAGEQLASMGAKAHRQVDQFGVTTDHEEKHYQNYLQASLAGRGAMLRGIQGQWDDYQAQVVALESTLEKLNLEDEKAQQQDLEQRAADYATRVIFGPDGESQDYQVVYDEFLLAEPEFREALEQSVADIHLSEEPHAVPMPALVPSTAVKHVDEDIELLAAAYADRYAAQCREENKRDRWFENAYAEYTRATPVKRAVLETKLEELETTLAKNSGPQHASGHVPQLSFSSPSLPNQPAQRMGVEEYITRARHVMSYLSEEELKQNYVHASKSDQEFAGLIETLQTLESEDPSYRGGRGWR